MVLLLFPVVVATFLKDSIPWSPVVEDPRSLQYFIMLYVASFVNLIVEVLVPEEVLALLITRLTVLPPALTRPSIVTLSAPLRSMSGLLEIFPLMDNPEVVG